MNKLKVLSVHTTNRCNYHCPFCYLDKSDLENEKPHQWWLEFFQAVDNTEQIALAWNAQPLQQICDYISIAAGKGIVVNLTCNPGNIDEIAASHLKQAGITMVSLSVDRYKCQNIGEARFPIHLLNSNDITVGINLLLDDDIVTNIEFVASTLYQFGADMVYALQPKPDTLIVSYSLLKSRLMVASAIFGKKFAIDEATKLKLGKSETCQRGNHLLSINSKGEVCLCSFDKGLYEYAGQLKPVETFTPECPFLKEN